MGELLMVPSIDYLSLIVAGAVLFHYGMEGAEPEKLDVTVAAVGVFLFIVGTGRAFMSAFGL